MSISEAVCSIVERETGVKVNAETALDTLPLDSLEFMDLLLKIGNEVGKEIPEGNLLTVGDIIRAC